MSARYFQQVVRQPSPGVPVLWPKRQPFRPTVATAHEALEAAEAPLPAAVPRVAKVRPAPKPVDQPIAQPIQKPVERPLAARRTPVPAPSVVAPAVHRTEIDSPEPDVRSQVRPPMSVVIDPPRVEPEAAELAIRAPREVAAAKEVAEIVSVDLPQPTVKPHKPQPVSKAEPKKSPVATQAKDVTETAEVPSDSPDFDSFVQRDEPLLAEPIVAKREEVRATPPSPHVRQHESRQSAPPVAGLTIGSIVVEILPQSKPQPPPPPVQAPAAKGRLSRDFGVFGLGQS